MSASGSRASLSAPPLGNTGDVVIHARGLSRSFDRITALSDLDLMVRKGEIVGVLGSNGAGKTTLCSLLLGLINSSSGQLEIFGRSYQRSRLEIAVKTNFCSPYIGLPSKLTVEQNLLTFARLYNVPNPRARLDEIVSHLALGDLFRRETGYLSSGQRTRVAMAKALLNHPELLVLDEPTAALDPETAHWMRDVLRSYARDHDATLVMTSHNMPEVELLCSRVILLARGRVVADCTPGEMKTAHGKESLEDAFLASVRAAAQNEVLA